MRRSMMAVWSPGPRQGHRVAQVDHSPSPGPGRQAGVGGSGSARRSEQRLAHPALVWLPGKAVLETVQAAGERVLGGWLAAGLDITIVYSDGRGTREPGLFGRQLVADQGWCATRRRCRVQPGL